MSNIVKRYENLPDLARYDRAIGESVDRIERASAIANVGVSATAALHRGAAFEVFSTLALYARMQRQDLADGIATSAMLSAYDQFGIQLVGEVSRLLGIGAERILHVVATAPLEEDERSWWDRIWS